MEKKAKTAHISSFVGFYSFRMLCSPHQLPRWCIVVAFLFIFYLSQLFLRNVDRYLTYSKSTSKSKREKIFSAYPKCSKYPFLRFFYSVCSTAPHLFPSAIIFYLSLGVCFAHFPHLRDLYIYVESSASYFFFILLLLLLLLSAATNFTRNTFTEQPNVMFWFCRVHFFVCMLARSVFLLYIQL